MIFLGIAGGSGSGKTTLAHRILDHFGDEHCQIISQDNFYKDQSHKFDHDGGAVNFDHPASIDFDLLTKHMQKLCEKKSINCPIYDFATHKRLPETIEVIPKKINILDGILIFTHNDLIDLFDYKIFTECPEQTRFERRLKRDIEERGRTEQGVRIQFQEQVKPMHDQYVEPSKSCADDIITCENFDSKTDYWINKLSTFL